MSRQPTNNGADTSHHLDQGIIDLRDLVSMVWKIAESDHVAHEVNGENLRQMLEQKCPDETVRHSHHSCPSGTQYRPREWPVRGPCQKVVH